MPATVELYCKYVIAVIQLLHMIAGILGVIVSSLVVFSGWAAIRRPLAALVEYDPLGKRMLATRGKAFTLRFYRIYGASLLLAGLAGLYISARSFG